MACAKVTDAGSDPAAAAALDKAGLTLEGKDKPVGLKCTAVKDPADANFCATATAYKGALALGTPGQC